MKFIIWQQSHAQFHLKTSIYNTNITTANYWKLLKMQHDIKYYQASSSEMFGALMSIFSEGPLIQKVLWW